MMIGNISKYVLLLTFFICSLSMSAVEVGGIEYTLNSDGTAEVAFKSGYYEGAVVIPAKFEYSGAHYTVTSIGWGAFSECRGLTSVEIPNSVNSIGDNAFYSCSNLKELTIADGPTNLEFGGNVFYETPIETLYLGRNFTCIDDEYANNPFCKKTSIKSLTISDSVTSIGNAVFSECSGLTSVEIPNSVTLISGFAFSDCSGLTSIVIPNSVTKIGSGAFWGCSSLTSASIGSSVTFIGDFAFCECSELKEVCFTDSKETLAFGKSVFEGSPIESLYLGRNIPYKTNYLEDLLFAGKESIKSLTIGETVTYIGNLAFYGCSGLTSVSLGNTLTSIGYGSFYQCSGLILLEIPSTVTSIEEYAFTGCTGLRTLRCEAVVPPTVNENSFSEATYGEAKLEVPEDGLSAYRNDDVWSKFANLSILGVDAVFGNEANAEVFYDIYDIQGILVKQACGRIDVKQLEPGVYILRGATTTVKVIIK